MEPNSGVIKQFEHSMASLGSAKNPAANRDSLEITTGVSQDVRRREITL